MQRVNNDAGTAPMVEGAVGILAINSTATAATTGLIPLAASGTNSFNKFYSNQINGGNYGIALSGFAATTPFAIGDAANDIGGLSTATGNTILNFGGAALASNAAAGIRANNQFGGLNISYNTVNNNNGSGANHETTLRGIYAEAGTSANATINNNTLSIQSGATTSGCNAIENGIGSTATSNTININNNVIYVGYSTATTGIYNAIVNTSTATTVSINSNMISQIPGVAFGGTATHIMIESGSPGTANTNNNTISNIERNGENGAWRIIKSVSPTEWNCNNNIIDGLSWSLAAFETGNIDAIYDLNSPTVVNIGSNVVRNLSTPINGVINGINIRGSSGTYTCTNNQIYNFSTTSGGVGGATFAGIAFSVLNGTISGNLIYSLKSTGTTGGAAGVITGIFQNAGNTNNIFKNKIYDLSTNSIFGTVFGIRTVGSSNINNNLIGDLRTPFGNYENTIRGIEVNGALANLYFNSVYINASSTAALFGTSALNAFSSTPLILRNNIFVNTSSTRGAGLAVAYRRTNNNLTEYRNASNKNLFFASTIFTDGTTSQTTFAAYQTAVSPRDANSINEAPNFLSTNGTDDKFLHINTTIATAIDNGADPISGIVDDFDVDTRNSTTPDIGADEFTVVVVLPISIDYFRGSKQATTNVLDWKVTCTTESSISMSLERSADGRSFKSLQDQTVTATRCLQGFNYVDAAPLAGYNYYRLKTVTLDGKVKYSTIVVLLNKEESFELISIAPNPVQNTAILSLTTVKGGKIELNVSDVTGKVISKQSTVVIAGNNPINMNFAALDAGTYIITAVNAEGEIKTTGFVKL